MRDRSEFDDLAPLIKLIRAHPPFDRETELVVTRKARKGNKRAQEIYKRPSTRPPNGTPTTPTAPSRSSGQVPSSHST